MCRFFRILSRSLIVIGSLSCGGSALNLSSLVSGAKSAASSAAQSLMNNEQVKATAVSAAKTVTEKAKTTVENKTASASAPAKEPESPAETSNEASKEINEASKEIAKETPKAQETKKSTEESASNSGGLLSGGLNKAKDVAKNVADSSAAEQIKAAALGAISSAVENNNKEAAPSVENTVQQQSAAQQQAAQATAEQAAKNQQIMAVVDPIFAEQDKIEKSHYISATSMNLTDEHMPYFVKKLSELSSTGIEKLTLNLADNMITTTGLSVLLDTLTKYVKLISVLSFSRNKIGDDGAFILAGAMPKMPVLKYIILSDTGITGAGAYAIISTISSKDCQVEMLDLSNNMIANEHLQPLFEQIKVIKASVLEDGVYLSNNMISLDSINMPIPPTVRDLKI
jgi:chemotaxis protein histidine kinase CheA